MYKVLFSFLLFFLVVADIYAQSTNGGIIFQAIARDAFHNPANVRKVYVQTNLLQYTVSGNIVLSEEHITNTDYDGVFTINIGLGNKIGGSKNNLFDIDWADGPYFLNIKIAIPPVSPTEIWSINKEWIDLGTSAFGVVPYALNILGAKQNSVVNVDSAIYKTKLNISDSLNYYVTPSQLAAKTFDIKPLNNSLITKLSLNDTASMLSNYVKIDELSRSTEIKLNIVDTASMLSNRFARDTISLSNRINLKDNVLNKSVNVNSPSDYNNEKYPSVKAIKDYVDAQIGTISSTAITGSALTFSTPLMKLSSNISLPKATSLNDGYLSSFDWDSFNHKISATEKASINGIATLGADGKIPSIQIPAISFSRVDVVASAAEMLALPVSLTGSFAIRSDVNKSFVLSALPATSLSNWVEVVASGIVTTVNGMTGPTISLSTSDIPTTINKRYITDAYLSTLANITGINTGDETNVTIKSKLGITTLSGTNTGDQDLSGYATTTDLSLKANAMDVASSLATKVDKVVGKELSTNDFTTAEKTKLSNISGTNTGDQILPTLSSLGAVAENAAIVASTKTKITYDAKGLVTGGADATTADVAVSANKNYVTDAMLSGVLSNTSGTNTGDETSATIKSKLGITLLSGTNTGDQDLTGYATTSNLALKANLISPTLVTPVLGVATATSITTGTITSTNDMIAKRYKLTMPSAITATASTTIDLSTGNIFTVNLGIPTTSFDVTSPGVGTYLIKFVQDATGSRDVTFPSAWKWSGGIAPNLTNTATKLDIVTLIYDGANYYATFVSNF